MNMNELGQEINEWAIGNGFYEPDKVRDFDGHIALVHSEVSEALEEWRDGRGFTEIYFHENRPEYTPETSVLYGWKPEGIPIELADIIIRVLDLCAYHKIDIERAVRLKVDYNKMRSYRNGGKRS
jgi:NTP pyrophosphatase (non-canonical NTP hydrolase)